MLSHVRLRTLLLYDFGIAVVFVLIGALSMYTLELLHPNRHNETAVFAQTARTALEQEQDLERLRARTLFYYDMSSYQRRSRAQDDERFFQDVRVLSFAVAALFVLNALFAALLAAAGEPEARTPAESGR